MLPWDLDHEAEGVAYATALENRFGASAGNASSQALDPDPPSQTETLFSLLLENPGCSTREAYHKLGLSQSRFYFSLGNLVSSQRILAIRQTGAQYLFPNHRGIESCWKQVVALHHESHLRMYRFLQTEKICPRGQLLQKTWESWDWPPPSTIRRLGVLLRVKLVARQSNLSSDRRQVWLKALPPAPPVLKLFPELASPEEMQC